MALFSPGLGSGPGTGPESGSVSGPGRGSIRRPLTIGAVAADRGQTNIDFAVGVSVFLTVVIFIFVFAPGVLAPFTAGNQEATVASDRLADQLALGMLGSPKEPYVLGTNCTVAFFEGKQPVLPSSGPVEGSKRDCAYLPDKSDVAGYPVGERVGATDRTLVNVTIQADINGDGTKTAVCWDAADEGFTEESTGNCDNDDDGTIEDGEGTVLVDGGLSPASSDVITARRTITVGNKTTTHTATLYVHVS